MKGKRILTLFLAILLTFSLVGCGNGADESGTNAGGNLKVMGIGIGNSSNIHGSKKENNENVDVDALEGRIEELECAIEGLEATIKELEGMVGTLYLEYDISQNNTGVSQDYIFSLEEDISDIGENVIFLEEDISNIGDKVMSFEGDISSIGNDVIEIHTEMSELWKNINYLYGKLNYHNDNVE